MPSRLPLRLQPGREARAHIAEAQDNYRRYERFLQTPEDTSWARAALFYSALHLVQAHAITKCALVHDVVPSNHNERIKYVVKHLGRVERDYGRLEDVSKAVRYDLWRSTLEENARYHDEAFMRIRTYLAMQNIAWSE